MKIITNRVAYAVQAGHGGAGMVAYPDALTGSGWHVSRTQVWCQGPANYCIGLCFWACTMSDGISYERGWLPGHFSGWTLPLDPLHLLFDEYCVESVA